MVAGLRVSQAEEREKDASGRPSPHTVLLFHTAKRKRRTESSAGLHGQSVRDFGHVVDELARFLEIGDALGVARFHRLNAVALLVQFGRIMLGVIFRSGDLVGIAGLGLPANT